MNLLVSLFSVIIIAAVILLSIGTGLLSKFFNFDIRKHSAIMLAISVAIALILIALSPYYEMVIGFTVYNFFFYIGLALLALILGILTFYLWRIEGRYGGKLKCLLYLDFIPVSYGLLIYSSAALSPSFVFDTANFSMTLTSFHLAIIIAVLLVFLGLVAYILSDFIEDYRLTDYPIIFGSMMVIFAFAFIVFGFLIPTISKVLEYPSTELTLMPINVGIGLLVFLALCFGIGALFKKRNNRLK